MRYLCMRLLTLGLLSLASVVGTPKPSFGGEVSVAEPFAAAGLKSLQRGDFEQAVSDWREAAQRYQTEGKLGQQSLALVYLSQAYQALGHYQEAAKNLELAVATAKSAGDRAQTALALGNLGNLYIATGTADTAQKYLQEGLSLARELGNSELTAT
jgi:tetratricopeptide (TPR) repeat protein